MRIFLTCLLLFCSFFANGQSLAELEKQLDSLLNKQQKSEVVAALSYGNNPAYGSKTVNLDAPIIMKAYLSPSLTWYHKSGFFAGAGGYCLLNTDQNHWFEWDFTGGYDYTKNRNFVTGISYTRYLFADSTDVPATPIKNEIFSYFYYRKWWLQPGVGLDYGWGAYSSNTPRLKEHVSGSDFNVIATVRHPFVFDGVLCSRDALLLQPSLSLTLGTANYYSQLAAFRYVTRSPKMKLDKMRPGKILNFEDHTDFEARAVDCTVNVSYLFNQFTFSPALTVFKPLTGTDLHLMGYFTARLAYSF
ncbi:hypothetical protein [Chitinophaga qingshengii]|uniref:DUF3078 domain-containing protein n=1 Tax=Chitinophaga qingshengii TaxID=1569794 RepID=A0ABR7TIK5_9BACT|nr:hypothetical protein [Chitinophaga qingshengii]MBC9930320.1 hypothetical protein [Chitinophaga qingshengii]